jgi:hypothetical protein
MRHAKPEHSPVPGGRGRALTRMRGVLPLPSRPQALPYTVQTPPFYAFTELFCVLGGAGAGAATWRPACIDLLRAMAARIAEPTVPSGAPTHGNLKGSGMKARCA